MTFEVLPAIDVAGGRLVSVSGGRVHAVEAFGGSPLAAAEAFVQAGARWLHLVDVDRADGRTPDLDLVRRIRGLGAAVQASGGIGSEDDARAALEHGASRVVLSSSVLADRARVTDMVTALGDHVVVGIEADGEVIRPRAAGATPLPLGETLSWLATMPATRYLATGLSRVAGLGGPDLEGVRRVAAALSRPVLVAGGIRDVDDVLALRDLGSDVVEGVVVGRALYEPVDLGAILSAVA